VPEWKWEEIAMDFIVGLPRTQSGYDSIWVIVDRLTKVAHFIPVRTTYSGPQLPELYMSRIVCMHGVFHVSQLKKCMCVPEEQIPMEDLDAKEDLSYQEHPVRILETSERVTRNKKSKMCKVQWSHHTEDKATWEREEELKAELTSFFSDPSESRG
jgi:hypothetical protein